MILVTINAVIWMIIWMIISCRAWKNGYNTGVKDMALKLMAETEQPQPTISAPKQSTIEVKTRFANETLSSRPAEVISRTARRELAEEMIKQLEDYVHIEQDNYATTFSLNLLVADKGGI